MLEDVEVKKIQRQRRGIPAINQSFTSRFANRTRIIFLVAGLIVLALAVVIFRHFQSDKPLNTKEKAIPVTVATATEQEVPLVVQSIGNVLAYSVVNVVPQVSGQLSHVLFNQGQYVKKGDLLFQIDPRPYDAALKQAEGNVARDKGQIIQAKANLQRDIAAVGQAKSNLVRDIASSKYAAVEKDRYSVLRSEGAVSSEQTDQMTTNAATAHATTDADKKAIENAEAVVKSDQGAIETAEGTLAADSAAVQNAQLQLEWTKIHSPIDGRTSSLNVYEGNIVNANTNGALVTIDQVQPIYVTFTVPEQYLDEVRKSLTNHTLEVQVLVEGRKKEAVEGAVSFLENTVNTTTGTVVLRAAFANTELRLFPGQFVDVFVSMPPEGKTVVVPTNALQTTQQGTAVYVVQSDNTVAFRPVKLKRTNGDVAALSEGVSANEVVVTDGQLQLTPGAKVQIVSEPK